jgi:drug/metabolite transporter (DMT)-like permease
VPTWTEAAAIVVLGVLVTAVAFVCWYTGVAVLGADRAGVLVGLMPVAGLVASVVLGRQEPTLVAAGGALVVAAGCVLGLSRRRPAPPGGQPDGARPVQRAVHRTVQ